MKEELTIAARKVERERRKREKETDELMRKRAEPKVGHEARLKLVEESCDQRA